MKDIKEYLNNEPIEEGWTGTEGDKAYEEILNVMESWKPEEILTLIWNYYSVDDLKNLYKWMKQDGYFD